MFKIIIVEDDKEIREELKILLENSGHNVPVLLARIQNVLIGILYIIATVITNKYLYNNQYELAEKII